MNINEKNMNINEKNMNMEINVLISCMHEIDTSIIQRSNIQTDVVVVNQCDKNCIDEWDFINKQGQKCHAKFINTTERGLSRSRNMAIANSWGDICLICDDDEELSDNYNQLILDGYKKFPDAGVLIFAIKDSHHVFPTEAKKMDFISILRSNSQQITFVRNVINSKNIFFDEKMGSGTGNGGGEEIRFMLDCRKKKLKMFYHPNCIATILPSKSQWFHGYTDSYFVNLGWTARRLFGTAISPLYLVYFMISHRTNIKKDNTLLNALRKSFKGWGEKR